MTARDGQQSTASRLDHLVVLRDRVQSEIDELEREALQAELVTSRPSAEALLRVLGVSALEVKRWAVERGHLSAVMRGRVPLLLVQAYAEEHR